MKINLTNEKNILILRGENRIEFSRYGEKQIVFFTWNGFGDFARINKWKEGGKIREKFKGEKNSEIEFKNLKIKYKNYG